MAKPLFKPSNYFKTIEHTDPNERVLCIVYRHPIGIIIVYIMAIIGLVGAFLILSLFMSSVISGNQSAYSLLAISAIMISVIVGLLMVVATYVYKQNKLTVTDHSVIQFLQPALFIKKISQLSLANVVDVTIEQKGILPNSFNYGTLKVETAGEQENFSFPFCQSPGRIAKIILDAKEDFLKSNNPQDQNRNYTAHQYADH